MRNCKAGSVLELKKQKLKICKSQRGWKQDDKVHSNIALEMLFCQEIFVTFYPVAVT